MSQSYAFDLRPDRFDLRVMTALQEVAGARRSYDRIVAEVQAGHHDRELLTQLPGLEALGLETSRKAALNVIDFHFEAIVMPRMTLGQVSDYLARFETQFHGQTPEFGKVLDIGEGGPLWIDSLHHVCVFSALHQLALHLAREHGYSRLVLLHQGLREEPRLAVLGRALKAAAGAESIFLPLAGDWFQRLARIVTLNTAIFYLADMPAAIRTRKPEQDGGASWVDLALTPGRTIRIETLSAATLLARRLGCRHLAADYPATDRIAFRDFSPDAPGLACPIEDWVFWPLINVACKAAEDPA